LNAHLRSEKRLHQRSSRNKLSCSLCVALQTQQRYHPAKTWSSQVQGINGMVARWGYFGFVATSEGRQLRDVAGQHLQVGEGCGSCVTCHMPSSLLEICPVVAHGMLK
jgi:hypothetical protein